MPTAALVEAIAREAEDNPFLVVEHAPGSSSAYDYALDTVAAPERWELSRKTRGRAAAPAAVRTRRDR